MSESDDVPTEQNIYANCLQGLRLRFLQVSVLESRVLDCIPSNWCDPLLTGPRGIAVPAGCPDIERLLNAIRAKVTQVFQEVA